MTERFDADDLVAIDADDRLLDALAAGHPTASQEPGALLLANWRTELDTAARLDPATIVPVPAESAPRRWSRLQRNAAGAAAAVVTLAATTGVAAAAGGTHGPLAPLHRLIFGGGSTEPEDAVALRADAILTRVADRVSAAERAGAIEDADRTELSGELDRVDTLLAGDHPGWAALIARSSDLRERLAAVPSPAPTGPAAEPGDDHGGTSGGHGSENTRSEDTQESGSTDRHGADGGADDTSTGSGDGGSSGGDDGSRDDSVDGGGDRTRSDSSDDSGTDAATSGDDESSTTVEDTSGSGEDSTEATGSTTSRGDSDSGDASVVGSGESDSGWSDSGWSDSGESDG